MLMVQTLRKVFDSKKGASDRELVNPVPASQVINDIGAVRPGERDPYSVTALSDLTDRTLHAATARFTAGISPAAVTQAYLDWATHLAYSPGKRAQLLNKAIRKALRFARYVNQYAVNGSEVECCIEPLPQDHRFADPAWQKWPFNFIYQAFLLQQQWWHNATTDVHGVAKRHEGMVEFGARQIIDTAAPSNLPITNPEVLARTIETGGLNLIKGWWNLLEDWERAVNGKKPVGAERFIVGRDVAKTPGKVVFRDRLLELIQYAPTTPQVRPEPILIIPAWIMKYYILDLSPHNSLVRYLTAQGFTVFMISWKNPGPDDREISMEDYRGSVMSAFDAVGAILPSRKVHTVGYCLGGTLLSIAAAAMSRDGDDRIATLTLFAAQTDFTEAGELMMLTDESQIAFLEDMMWEQGFLDSRQMAGMFQILRSNDLIWSRAIHDYLLGERPAMNDLMAWNADTTRMPYRMHSQYLRGLFLNNDLAEGRYVAAGKPVALSDLRAPIFAVGTERDHVAPWRSTYKINLQTPADVTYVLTTGGHNAGIVSEPGHHGRSFRIAELGVDRRYLDPDGFLMQARRDVGSWWPRWAAWLTAHSGTPTIPPPMGAPETGYMPVVDAPGQYVFME
jgi:polyhydroxyalkanoate synthase subunit PhaC